MPKHCDSWFLRRLPSGAPVWIACCPDVSQIFGWDRVFDPYPRGTDPVEIDGVIYKRVPIMKLRSYQGGSRIRVLRGPDKGVFTKGLTHSFRLRGTWSPRDLRQAMAAVQVDWNWLKLPDGRVWDKERLAQSNSPGPVRGAGLSRK